MTGQQKGNLLDAPQGVRPEWAKEVGKPSRIGIQLIIFVDPIDDKNLVGKNVRGVVDVSSLPYGDVERHYLAKVLFDATAIRDKQRFKFTLLGWLKVKGGQGIRIAKCDDIQTITSTDIIGEIKIYTSPDVELDDRDSIGQERRSEWVRDYGENRYLRFVKRKELHQRLQDIAVNMQVITQSGKLGLTTDDRWPHLLQHVITEMHHRAEPPEPWNRDPRVSEALPFKDGELCRKAAKVVAACDSDHEVIVKYGKREYMEKLLRGEIYLNSASKYNQSVHNQAVRDNELEIEFNGGILRSTRPMRFYSRDDPPPEFRDVGFLPIYKCPKLELHETNNEYATMSIKMSTDYWMFCMANVLDQRLFADFEADCCLIIRQIPFVHRVIRAVTMQLPNVTNSFGRVDYVDPLGAFSPEVQINHSIPIHMTKIFRYAYQREVRLTFLPMKHQQELEPMKIQIGSIADIAELVPLN